jgi:hypothetical protein
MKNTPERALSAGIARADITPPIGIPSSGFAGRGPLNAHHDPLYATVMVASNNSQKAALVSCDLLDLDAETVARIRDVAADRTGIDAARITIACIHTHYGPDAYRSQDKEIIRAYRANLIHTVAGAIQEAACAMSPIRLGVAWGESDIGINRREKRPDGQIVLGNNPTGPIDRSLAVVRIDHEDGAPLACLVNFQTHPVSQASRTRHISADYVGRARQVIEKLTGATCLYLQGASGNINPILMAPGYEPARTLGTRLGCQVVQLWETILTGLESTLDVQSEDVHLPRLSFGSLQRAQALVQELEQELAESRDQAASAGRIWWLERRLERAREALES